MLLALLSLVISSIPSVLLFRYLRNLRKDELEYRKHCRRLLLRGVLCSVGVAVLDLIAGIVWKIIWGHLGRSPSPIIEVGSTRSLSRLL